MRGRRSQRRSGLTATGSSGSSPSSRCRRTRCSAPGGSCQAFCRLPTRWPLDLVSLDRSGGRTCSGIATPTGTAPPGGGRRRRRSSSRARRSTARRPRDEAEVEVRGRLGIDRHPVDVTSDEAARLLQLFVWADQHERLERLRRAIEVVRRDPPRLVRGDDAEELPRVLARRDLDVLTLVFHSVSLGYLPREVRGRVREAIATEGKRSALAHVSYEFVEDEPEAFGGFALDVTTYPGGETDAARAARRARQPAAVGRMITSASNPRLKLVRKLASRRQRAKLGLFVCEGEDLVAAGLDAGLAPARRSSTPSGPPSSSGSPARSRSRPSSWPSSRPSATRRAS